MISRGMNSAGMGVLARRLMALERARAMGRKPLDLQGWALEQAAQRWARERAESPGQALEAAHEQG